MNDEYYKQALKREQAREKEYRKTKQGRFEADFVSFDDLCNGTLANDKLRCLGTLSSVIAETPDDCALRMVRNKNRLKHACEKLRRHGLGHLVRTLQLIAKNVNNREESICQLMKDALRDTSRQNNATSASGRNSANSSRSTSTKAKKAR